MQPLGQRDFSRFAFGCFRVGDERIFWEKSTSSQRWCVISPRRMPVSSAMSDHRVEMILRGAEQQMLPRQCSGSGGGCAARAPFSCGRADSQAMSCSSTAQYKNVPKDAQVAVDRRVLDRPGSSRAALSGIPPREIW